MKIFVIFFILIFTSFVQSKAYAQKEINNGKFSLPYKTLSLPGNLDNIPFFNSNSPELVTTEGILLSTFPQSDKIHPDAHLNRTFEGRFDIFTHHITPQISFKRFYQGILIKNATNKEVVLKIISASTYLTKEATFKKLPDFTRNFGEYFAGPGDRVSQDILRAKRITLFDKKPIILLKPNETYILMNLPLVPGNERTSQFKLESDGPVYIADLTRYENTFLWLPGTPPKLYDWMNILKWGKLAEKRDKIPTNVDKPLTFWLKFIYGRVSGITTGTTWNAEIVNDRDKFIIPEHNTGIAYVLNTMHDNTLGTNQRQTMKIDPRYQDTAYYSNGNYGVTYNINIPFYNNTKEQREVKISFDTPIRLPENQPQKEISFYRTPPEKVFFRGELRVKYKSYFGFEKEKYFHLVQRSGQKGDNLLTLILDPEEVRNINLSFVYPADATAPHVLTIEG